MNKVVKREIFRWEGRRVFYSTSLEQFSKRPALENGIHSFKEKSLFFDFWFENRNSENTIIYFHPDIDNRKEKALPFFVGTNVIGGTANHIIVSDPCLYADQSLSLAWYAGTGSCDAQGVITKALRRFVDYLGGTRLIFSGISGGGFASLYFSHQFPGSIAVPINPQTFIGNFTLARVFEYLRLSYGIKSMDEVPAQLKQMPGANLNTIYRAGFRNNVLYVQNSSDHHVKLHLEPFKEATAHRSECMRPLQGFWGQGHIAPKVPQQRQLMQQLEDWKGDWSSLLRDADFSWLETKGP